MQDNFSGFSRNEVRTGELDTSGKVPILSFQRGREAPAARAQFAVSAAAAASVAGDYSGASPARFRQPEVLQVPQAESRADMLRAKAARFHAANSLTTPARSAGAQGALAGEDGSSHSSLTLKNELSHSRVTEVVTSQGGLPLQVDGPEQLQPGDNNGKQRQLPYSTDYGGAAEAALMRPPAARQKRVMRDEAEDPRAAARRPNPSVGGVSVSLDELREMQVWLAQQRAAKAAAQHTKQSVPKPKPAPDTTLVPQQEEQQPPTDGDAANLQPEMLAPGRNPEAQAEPGPSAPLALVRDIEESELMRRDAAGPYTAGPRNCPFVYGQECQGMIIALEGQVMLPTRAVVNQKLQQFEATAVDKFPLAKLKLPRVSIMSDAQVCLFPSLRHFKYAPTEMGAMKTGALRCALTGLGVHSQVVNSLLSAPRLREYLKYAAIRDAFDAYDKAAAEPEPDPDEALFGPPSSPAPKADEEAGEMADFTPGLRASLLVARVSPNEIASDAPRSSADAMGAAPNSFGSRTPAVRQLASATSLRRALSPELEARGLTPVLNLTQVAKSTAKSTAIAQGSRKQRSDDKLNAAIAELLDVWPVGWIKSVLGGSEQAKASSQREASVALMRHLQQWGGNKGVHLRQSLAVVFGEHGFVAYRRYYREPQRFDFPITGAAMISFATWRHATSTATARGGGGSVELGVHNALQRAHTYLGLPMYAECVFDKLVTRRGGAPPRSADTLPEAVVQYMESAAVGNMLAGVGTYYVRMFLLMLLLRARAKDMSTARDFAVADVIGMTCITCCMNMKDGSVGAWCGIPAVALNGPLEWAPEHLEQRRGLGYTFPEFACPFRQAGNIACQQAAFVRPYAEATESRVAQAWGSLIADVAVRYSLQALTDKSLWRLTGHSPRHWAPNWAARFAWSLPAREELGRWAGDVLLLAGEERDTRQRASRAICAVRYASAASQETQLRLLIDLLRAIASVLPDTAGVHLRIEASVYYKKH